MKWAQQVGGTGGRVLLAAALLVIASLLGWREWGHHQAAMAGQLELAGIKEQLAERTQQLEQAEAGKRRRSELIAEAEIRIQTLHDRVSNLEAQRDHLRAENSREAELAKKAAATAAEMQSHLERARHELLLAQEQPRKLEYELEAAHSRIGELEDRIDRQSVLQSHLPDSMELAGLSSDRAVFSLRGPLPEGLEFPSPVYLCRTDGILLDGWMHRLEGELVIGHVEHWRRPSSTLVKGEKVFILPRTRHEADH